MRLPSESSLAPTLSSSEEANWRLTIFIIAKIIRSLSPLCAVATSSEDEEAGEDAPAEDEEEDDDEEEEAEAEAETGDKRKAGDEGESGAQSKAAKTD